MGFKKIYLASPFWNDDPKIRVKRFKSACKAAANIFEKYGDQYIVLSPIAHSYSVSKYGKMPVPDPRWYDWDRALLEVCDEVWVLDIDGWNESVGVQKEIQWAKEADKPLKMVTPRGRKYGYKYE